MKRLRIYSFIAAAALFSACSSSVKQEAAEGETTDADTLVMNAEPVDAIQTESDNPAIAAQEPAEATPEVDEATKKVFAEKFKSNIVADSKWTDSGWNEEENYGKCYIYVNNRNPEAVDGSDYYITYKYEYLYEGGASMHSENCRQNGKTIEANGKVKFSHHYTDDCGPLKVKIHYNLTDEEIYDKYAK